MEMKSVTIHAEAYSLPDKIEMTKVEGTDNVYDTLIHQKICDETGKVIHAEIHLRTVIPMKNFGYLFNIPAFAEVKSDEENVFEITIPNNK